jgi:toxin ParE1/3/4
MRLRITKPASQDLAAIQLWTRDHFGTEAAHRYGLLIRLASREIAHTPSRIGVQPAYEGAEEFLAYHLRFSARRLAAAQRVTKPRHLLVFKIELDCVVLLRILHDSMDAKSHLDSDSE